MATLSKPRMFVGSSLEGLAIAYALHANVSHELEVTVWSQGIFKPSDPGLDSLIEALGTQDFGAFIFSPDDVSKIRGEDAVAVRDNVLFELGLYMGHLGRDRSFFVVPDSGALRTPTDLAGITALRYEAKRSDNNWQAATGPAGFAILEAVKRVGPRPRVARAEAVGSGNSGASVPEILITSRSGNLAG